VVPPLTKVPVLVAAFQVTPVPAARKRSSPLWKPVLMVTLAPLTVVLSTSEMVRPASTKKLVSFSR